MYGRGATLLVVMSLLLGCTELEVNRLAAGTPTPAKGYSYSLPFARYKISIVRTLLDCSDSQQKLLFDIGATVTTVFEPDPAQTFTIDNESLVHAFKTSELSIERFENQMLKSIGGTSTDETGKVIVNSLTGVLKLAQTAIVGASVFEYQDATKTFKALDGAPAFCNDEILKVAYGIAAMRESLRLSTQNLDVETKRLKLMGDAVGTFGKAPTEAIQNALFEQAQAVAKLQAEVGQKQAQVQKAIEDVSDVETFVWPPDGMTVSELHQHGNAQWAKRFVKTDAKLAASIQLDLTPLNGLALPIDASTGRLPTIAAGDDLKGIRYRNPVPGALSIRLCNTAFVGNRECKEAAFSSTQKVETLFVRKTFADGPVPQFGRLMVIPFENHAFQANSMSATFGADGNLLTAKQAETKSQAEVASDTFNQVAGSLLQASKDLPTAGVNAKTTALNAKVAELEAQKKLEAAKLALEPTGVEENSAATAIIASDTALKDAQLKNILASQALEKAQAQVP